MEQFLSVTNLSVISFPGLRHKTKFNSGTIWIKILAEQRKDGLERQPCAFHKEVMSKHVRNSAS